MQNDWRALLPFALKVVLPPLLGAVGALVAALYSEGFRAFCGV